MDCIAKAHRLGAAPSTCAEYMWLTQADIWMPICAEHCAGWRRSAIPATMPKRIKSITEDDELIGAYLALGGFRLVWHEGQRESLLGAARLYRGDLGVAV